MGNQEAIATHLKQLERAKALLTNAQQPAFDWTSQPNRDAFRDAYESLSDVANSCGYWSGKEAW